MQTNHPILSGLIKLHADLGGQIFENRKRAEKLAGDMKHVEAVIRMFEPGFNLKAIAPRRRHKGNAWFKRGTLFRHALEALRKAAMPLTARDLTLAMLAAQGVSAPDQKAVRDLIGGVQASLRNNEGKTVRRVGEVKAMPAKWALIV